MNPGFWLWVAVGWSAMGFGVWKLVERSVPLNHFVVWFFGGLAVHDFVVAPIVYFTGLALSLMLPRSVWRFLRPALIATAMVLLFAVPFLGRFGADADNPTILPNNYVVGTALTVGVVWAAAVVVWIVGLLRRPTAGESASR